MKELNNFTLKPINEFNNEDTFYMQKKKQGYTYTFLLKFNSISGCIVYGKILDIQPNNNKSIVLNNVFYKIDSLISSPMTKCYTYKNGQGARWFRKVDGVYKCE